MFDLDHPTGRPKWIDFNFAGVDPKTNALLKLRTAAVGVSLGFAPPEFFDGSTQHRSRESDVYSLGRTFAALLEISLPDDLVTSAAPTPSREAAREVLGTPVYDKLLGLLTAMTRPAPEKRISLTQDTPLARPGVSQVLQGLASDVADAMHASKAAEPNSGQT